MNTRVYDETTKDIPGWLASVVLLFDPFTAERYNKCAFTCRCGRNLLSRDYVQNRKSCTTLYIDDDDDGVNRTQSPSHGGARIAPYTEHTQASSYQSTHGYNAALSTLPAQKVSSFLSYPST